MSKIANNFGTTIDRLAKDNNIKNVNMIYANENLIIAKDDDASVAQHATVTQTEQPVVQQPEQETVTTPAKVEQTTQASAITNSSAKDTLVNRESGGSYTASNPSGAYGKYQLMPFNLKYGTSPEGQDRAAEEYVVARYGSWENALAHSNTTGWY